MTAAASQPYLRTLGQAAAITADGTSSEFSLTQRRILARLALSAPRPVQLDDLVAAAWDETPPRTARQAVQNQISRIRQQAGEHVVGTVGDAYQLGLDTDVRRIRDDAARAEQLLCAGEETAAFELADAVLALCVGEAFAEIAHLPAVAPIRRALHASRASAENIRLEAAIVSARRGWALHEAERLAGQSPLDEHRAALHARALILNGRRSDALAVIGRTRRLLRTKLGIEIGPDLAAAELHILRATSGGSVGNAAGLPGPLVGRDRELRTILGEVARDRPLLVRGEHGIGVSRLLLEARARLTSLGLRVVLVQAEEHPYSAVSLLEQVLDELDVPVRPGHSALSAFADLLAGRPEVDTTGVLVLIVDDAQHLGPSVAALLAEAATAAHLRIILGGHGPDVPFADAVELLLGPLDHASVGALARRQGVQNTEMIDWLYAHSGGNPLVLQVLLDQLDVATDTDDALPELDAASPALQTLVARLVAPLDAQQRHDLELAAVAGDGYPRAAFDELVWSRRPDPPGQLVEWTVEGTQRFRHGAVRALLYESLPRGQVVDMHHALGLSARAAGAAPAIVASHLLAAAEVDQSAAIAAARAAAVAASRLGAHADAAGWLARAIRVDPGTDPRGSLAVRIEHADALRLGGDPEHLSALLAVTDEAFALRDDELIAAACFALLQLGGSSPAGELDAQIRAHSRRAVAAIRDPQLRAPVQAAASLAWSMTGNAAQCRRLFDQAEAAARRPEIRARVLPFAYLALGRPGDLPRRGALATELVDLGRAADDAVALFEGLHLQFSVHLQRGDGAALRACLAEMQLLVERVGDVGRRWSVLYCSAALAHLDGDDAACERLAGEAHAMFGRVSAARAASAFYGQLLPLYLGLGRLRELRPFVEVLVAEQPGVPAWHAALALVLAMPDDDGRPPAASDRMVALEQAGLALDLAQEDFLWLACHLVGGRAVALLVEGEGDSDGGDGIELARRYRELLEPWSDLVCWQGTCGYGPVATVLALLARAVGEESAAADYAARAVSLARSLGAARYEKELAELGFAPVARE